MGADHVYEAVKGADDGSDEYQPPSPPPKTAWWKFALCNVLAAGAGAGVMYFVTGDSYKPLPTSSAAVSVATPNTVTTDVKLPDNVTLPDPFAEHVQTKNKSQNALTGIILDCGHSPEEARAKDCIYDVMMQDWVPKPCYDSVLTDRYLAEGNWTWYGDWDGNKTLSNEEMSKGEHGVAWMANSYHKAHCVFSWMKIVRALRNDWGISEELLSYDHVMHCSMGALKINDGLEAIGVSAPTNYARCALYDTWLENPLQDKHDSTQ